MSSRKPKQEWLNDLKKRRKKRFQTLMSGVKASPLAGSEIVFEPPGKERMSEVLEEFVEPYMDTVEDADDFRNLLELGVLAWNAALLPHDEREAMFNDAFSKELRRVSPAVLMEFQSLVSFLVERKLTHFATNKRAFISFEVKDTGRGFHLTVATTL